MQILAVTSFRPDEVMHTVDEMDADTEVVVVDEDGGLLTRSVETVRGTRRAVRSHDPDVVLLDCYEVMGFLVSILSLVYGVPLVARLVGDPWRMFGEEGARTARENRNVLRYVRTRLSLLLDSIILDQATGFVVVSAALKDVVRERTGCPPERIEVVPVPVTKDTRQEGSAERARRSLDIDEGRVVLTVTNLLFEAKFVGVETILDELKPLLQRDEDLAFVVAGDGPYLSTLETRLDGHFGESGPRHRVYTPGYVDTVSDLYALADVFVYVSHLDGYPKVVLEAQTAGLPVVVNDAFGMREQVTDGETGFLVEPSVDGLIRERVEYLLSNAAARNSIGERARLRVKRENTGKVVSEQTERFLRSLLNG